MWQGLVVAAGAVSTPYSYNVCSLYLVTPTSRVCLSFLEIEVDSAPVTPPFVYNNQCASVLLTSYIPVLILGFSMQIVLCFIMPLLLSQLGRYIDLSKIIHNRIIKGIIWPEFWLNSDDSDVLSRNQARLAKHPTSLLNPKSILCFDVLNNMMIMLTFGLCSPILAVAVACTVVSKMIVLMLMVGRFAYILRSDDANDSTHFAMIALAKVHFPLIEVLKESFWLILWTSALFFSFVCWDVASDDVGWLKSIWIPIVTTGYPLVLWLVAISVNMFRDSQFPRRDDCEEEKEIEKGNMRGTDMIELLPLDDAARTSAMMTNNPIHRGM